MEVSRITKAGEAGKEVTHDGHYRPAGAAEPECAAPTIQESPRLQAVARGLGTFAHVRCGIGSSDQMLVKQGQERVRVEFTIAHPKPYDPDNAIGCLKPVFDGQGFHLWTASEAARYRL